MGRAAKGPAARVGLAAATGAAARFAAVGEHAEQAALLLKALANDQRLLMLCSLLDGPLSVGAINERVPLSQSALSQHLGVLREAGLVTTRRRAQTILYALAEGPVPQILEILYATYCAPPPSKRGASRPRGRS